MSRTPLWQDSFPGGPSKKKSNGQDLSLIQEKRSQKFETFFFSDSDTPLPPRPELEHQAQGVLALETNFGWSYTIDMMGLETK